MKRVLDILLCVLLMIFLLPVMLLIAISIKLTSSGSVLYWSNRIGKSGVIFGMPKFRTMLSGTPSVATHLLENPHTRLTIIGGFLRRSSLDELPQLYSVLKGDMSFVGPRPALFNQDDLVVLRAKHGVDKLMPGITGWAQVNGRDELSIPDKVALDIEYLNIVESKEHIKK